MIYQQFVQALVDALNGSRLRYMLVGGIAVNYWGFPRATLDIDLAVALETADVDRMRRLLKALRCDAKPDDVATLIRISNCIMTHSRLSDYRIDFWIPRTVYEQEALGRRRRAQVYGKTSWVIAPEDLMIMKLLAGRGKDLDDALGVLNRQRGRLDEAYLKHQADRLDLREVLKRIQQQAGG